MLRDSRYTVEQWLAARVGPGELVGFVFPRQYYPRLEPFNSARDRVACRSCRRISRRISS